MIYTYAETQAWRRGLRDQPKKPKQPKQPMKPRRLAPSEVGQIRRVPKTEKSQ